MALTTEAQPLMPQTHGTRSGARCASRDNARGNGIPMQKASGAISNSDLSGDNEGNNNKDMGSRGLFHLYTELGYRVTQHMNVSVFYEHYSNAGLGTINPGMNNLGMRLGYRF